MQSFVMKLRMPLFSIVIMIALFSCDHSKPKPVSTEVTKTAVTVNGKKDSVINNPEKNYGNATVSEPCVKCVITFIQSTAGYKALSSSIPQQDIIYDVNWITSKTPKNMGNGKQIINGLQVTVSNKGGGSPKPVTTYLYDNEDAQFYGLNAKNQYTAGIKADSARLKKIRNSCFWGVASAK